MTAPDTAAQPAPDHGAAQPASNHSAAQRASNAATPETQGEGFWSFFTTVAPLLRPHWRRAAAIQFFLLLEMSYELALPLGGKYLIDVIIPGRDPHRLLLFLLILLAVYLLNPVLGAFRAYRTVTLTQQMRNDLQLRVFSHLQYLPLSFYARTRAADIGARLSSDMNVVSSAIKDVMGNGLYYSAAALVAAVSLLILNPLLAVLALIVVPLSLLVTVLPGGRVHRLTLQQQTQAGDTSAFVQENLAAPQVVKAFGLEPRAIGGYQQRLRHLLATSTRLSVVEAIGEEGVLAATALGQVVILGAGGYFVMRHHLSLGTLVAFIGLLPALFTPVQVLLGVAQDVQGASGALTRVTRLLKEPLTIADRPGALTLPAINGEVRLDHVSAGYTPGRPILRDVSLTIPAGAHIAVVGPSGSGKSTLINLLPRFWDPDEGTVRLDGHDLRDLNLDALRAHIGLVFQDAIVFEASLRENIAIARPGATDAEIGEAARAARLDDLIAALPDGLDTLLGERGVRLSGGQRQRLSLARVYLRRPRLLILDEATSALDAQTEKEIVATLAALAQHATTINITHRLALATLADSIVVLDQGRIVEQGPHATLVRAGGLYQRLYEEQTALPVDARAGVGAEEARLGAVPLFAGLGPPALAAIAAQMGRQRVAAGTDIVRQGDPGDALYIIARGHVEVLLHAAPRQSDGPLPPDTPRHPDAERQRDDGAHRIDALDEGDYFGEMALLSGAPRNASVRATVPTELFTLSRDAFLALLERHPEMQPHIDAKLAERRANLGWTTPAPPTPSGDAMSAR